MGVDILVVLIEPFQLRDPAFNAPDFICADVGLSLSYILLLTTSFRHFCGGREAGAKFTIHTRLHCCKSSGGSSTLISFLTTLIRAPSVYRLSELEQRWKEAAEGVASRPVLQQES